MLVLVIFTFAAGAAEQEPRLTKCTFHTSIEDILAQEGIEEPRPSCRGQFVLTHPGSLRLSYDHFDKIDSLTVEHQRMRRENGDWSYLYAKYWLLIEFPSGKVVSLPFEAGNDIFAVSELSLGPGMDLIVLTRWSERGTGYLAHEMEIWRALEGDVEKVFDSKLAEFITRTPPGEHFSVYYEVYIVREEEKEEYYSTYKNVAVEMRRVMKNVPQDLRQEYGKDFAPILCLVPTGERLEAVTQDCETALRAARK